MLMKSLSQTIGNCVTFCNYLRNGKLIIFQCFATGGWVTVRAFGL